MGDCASSKNGHCEGGWGGEDGGEAGEGPGSGEGVAVLFFPIQILRNSLIQPRYARLMTAVHVSMMTRIFEGGDDGLNRLVGCCFYWLTIGERRKGCARGRPGQINAMIL